MTNLLYPIKDLLYYYMLCERRIWRHHHLYPFKDLLYYYMLCERRIWRYHHLYPIKDILYYYILCVRRVWRYQRSNQNPYIDKRTTQLPKEKVQKNKQRSTKHTHKLKSITNPITTGGELRCSGRVDSSWSLPYGCSNNHYILWVKFEVRFFKQLLYTVTEVWGKVVQTIIIYCEWSLRYGCSNNHILWV